MLKLPEILRGQSFVDGVVAYAFNRNPGLLKIDQKRVYEMAGRVASEIADFEELARTNPLRIPQTPDGAKRMIAIWDLSGVGTYLKKFQDDRWKGTTWAAWTDRRRLNYSGALMRRVTEKVTGNKYEIPKGQKLTSKQTEDLRHDIEKFGPFLIYGSTAEQNEDVETALAGHNVIIPRSKVHIIDFPEKPVGVNTIDQMRAFSFPPNLQVQKENILAIVAHAPHMVRILHMMNRFQPIPEGLIVQPHPLPSVVTDSAKQEISGLLFYTLITEDSAEEAYPYHG